MLINKLQKRWKRSGSIALSLLIMLSLVLSVGCNKNETEPSDEVTTQTSEKATITTPETTPEETEPQVENAGQYSRLNGQPMDEDMVNRASWLSHDNHPNARPQAGLRQADIVFEMKVEGTYTRYLAFFQSEDPEIVGSIRSARDCF